MRTILAQPLMILLSALLLFPALQSNATAKSYSIQVAVGARDRRGTVVSFMLPEEARGKQLRLRGTRGQSVALQADMNGRAYFILPNLKANSTETLRLETINSKNAAPSNQVEVTRSGSKLLISVAGREALGYQTGPGELPRPDIKPIYRRAGYIHPVLTPAGRMVTDDYPPNHLHHHGIWAAWTKTEFEGRKPDFWNMGDGTGTVKWEALDGMWSGPVYGGFRSRHTYVDLSAPQPRSVLNETWEVTVYNVSGGTAKPYRVFDLVTTQENVASSTLKLPTYHYGGLGFRGNRQWDGKENTIFLTSEGRDRTNGHATRARWCHIGGRIDGELAGIAILDHPGNFRAPQPMRIHPTEPFFCYAPSQLGDWQIEPGQMPYVARYRFIVYDGPPDTAEIERLWQDYADPPRVTITAK